MENLQMTSFPSRLQNINPFPALACVIYLFDHRNFFVLTRFRVWEGLGGEL